MFDGPLRSRLVENGLAVEVVGSSRRYDPLALKAIKAALGAHRTTVAHTHGYKATILGGIAARMSRIAVVHTEHGRLEPGRGLDHLKMRANELAERLIARMTIDADVAVTKDVQAHSKPLGSDIARYVVYNGLDAEPGYSVGKALPHQTFDVGIVGRLAPVKGHRYLIDAVRRLTELPNIRLLIFGEGPLDAELRSYCQSEVLRGRVVFMGFRDNIRQHMAGLDVLAIPSLHEGLPFTLLEGMHLGLPIVASDVGGLAEVLANGATALLVPPTDSAALGRAIERLYREPGIRASLAHRAKKVVDTHFLADTMAERYLEIYSSLLHEGVDGQRETI